MMTRVQPGNPSIIAIIVIWVLLGMMLIFTLAPLLYMVTASAMPRNDILKMPYRWIPKGFHWQNFWKAIKGNDGSFIFSEMSSIR
jgi:multiple sugar transport system permease protein